MENKQTPIRTSFDTLHDISNHIIDGIRLIDEIRMLKLDGLTMNDLFALQRYLQNAQRNLSKAADAMQYRLDRRADEIGY